MSYLSIQDLGEFDDQHIVNGIWKTAGGLCDWFRLTYSIVDHMSFGSCSVISYPKCSRRDTLYHMLVGDHSITEDDIEDWTDDYVSGGVLENLLL